MENAYKFLTDEKAVHDYIDKYAHHYEKNPSLLADFIREMDKMSHVERLKIILPDVKPECRHIAEDLIK